MEVDGMVEVEADGSVIVDVDAVDRCDDAWE